MSRDILEKYDYYLYGDISDDEAMTHIEARL